MHEYAKIAAVDAGNRDILGIIDSLSFVKVRSNPVNWFPQFAAHLNLYNSFNLVDFNHPAFLPNF